LFVTNINTILATGGSIMPGTDIEGILEKKVNVLKEKVESKQRELQELHAELKKYERTLGSLRGNFFEKRGRAKKEKSEQIEESQFHGLSFLRELKLTKGT
jgi:tRNA G46 methylase TrmB